MPSFSLPNLPEVGLPNLLESDPVALYAATALVTVIAGAVLWRLSRGAAMMAGTVAALALWGGATSWAIATLPPPAPMATEATVAELAAQVELLSAELRALAGRGVSAMPRATPEQPPAPLAGVVAGPEPAPPPGATRPSATLAAAEAPDPEDPPLIATPVPYRDDDPTAVAIPDWSALFSHVVVQGDRLHTIARLYLPPDRGLTEFANRIVMINRIYDPGILKIGRTLWIPAQ